MNSPFTPEHELFRKTVRDFAEKELLPNKEKWETDKEFPTSVFKKAGELGILGVCFPEAVGGSAGDYWFKVVFCEEIVRCRMAGVAMDLLVQADIATPVIDALGTQEQKDLFLKPAVAGDKIGALGVTEPGCGSDVMNIKTTAK
ncbi:MAG TPA: acyl-CoA dehydrogenase family protein, partial [bacterium]|nr:acyl-CoA dehydrogenase family protein [bacterium]